MSTIAGTSASIASRITMMFVAVSAGRGLSDVIGFTGREKCVFESRLKRAGFCFIYSKSRTDFRLSGDVNFDTNLPALSQRGANCVESEFGRVAIPAEV